MRSSLFPGQLVNMNMSFLYLTKYSEEKNTSIVNLLVRDTPVSIWTIVMLFLFKKESLCIDYCVTISIYNIGVHWSFTTLNIATFLVCHMHQHKQNPYLDHWFFCLLYALWVLIFPNLLFSVEDQKCQLYSWDSGKYYPS